MLTETVAIFTKELSNIVNKYLSLLDQIFANFLCGLFAERKVQVVDNLIRNLVREVAEDMIHLPIANPPFCLLRRYVGGRGYLDIRVD